MKSEIALTVNVYDIQAA